MERESVLTSGRRHHLVGGRAIVLAGFVAVGLSGCSSAASGQPSAIASANQTAQTGPTASLAVTPSPTASATAQPPLNFGATGIMHTARIYASATLLKNGKVLIAGGTDSPWGIGEKVYSTAELYDPATGQFAKTGSMHAARADQTTTLLADGRVLVTGGYGCSGSGTCGVVSTDDSILASAELYDPATGKFTVTGSLAAPRAEASATLLPDGRVLLTGGHTSNLMAELYDASSGKFTETAKDPVSGAGAPAVLLPGAAKVLEASGGNGTPLVGSLYDLASGKFTKICLEPAPSSMPSAQPSGPAPDWWSASSATVLKDGRVLLFEGGYLETYDPASGACTDVGFIAGDGRYWAEPTATLLPDGRVLFVGGVTDAAAATSSNETSPTSAVLYDPSSGSHAMVPLKTPRTNQTATLLADGSVLIAGGYDNDTNSLSSAELLKP